MCATKPFCCSCITGVLISAILALPAAAQAARYSFVDDFSAGTVRSEWSAATTSLIVATAPSGEKFLGSSADGLYEDDVSLTLSGLPSNRTAIVQFDLYIIRSMDGSEPFLLNVQSTAPATDLFNFASTFCNHRLPLQITGFQDYPWPGSPPLTGALKINSLGYSLVNPTHNADSTYRLKFEVPYLGTGLKLRFHMYGLELGPSDESWGLDNVKVVVY